VLTFIDKIVYILRRRIGELLEGEWNLHLSKYNNWKKRNLYPPEPKVKIGKSED